MSEKVEEKDLKKNESVNESEKAEQGVGTNAFDIFNTNVEDMTSYEEEEQYEKKDYSKIYFEPDPKKAGKKLTYLIKFCPNIYAPKDNIPKRYTYKIPIPERPNKNFTWISPSTVGKACPVMQAFFDFRESNDARLNAIAEKLKRKRYRCAVIQIISSPNEPELTGQFRLFRFPEGREIDQMIQKKMFPSDEDIELGIKGENVFDPFESPIMILRVQQGDYGRDFKGSEWAEKDRNHGIMLCEYDENGLAIDPKNKKILLKRSDAGNKEYQNRIIELLKADNISLKDIWMFQEPSDEYLEKANKSVEMMRTGEISGISAAEASDENGETGDSDKTAAPVETDSEEKPKTDSKPAAEQAKVDKAKDQAVAELFDN